MLVRILSADAQTTTLRRRSQPLSSRSLGTVTQGELWAIAIATQAVLHDCARAGNRFGVFLIALITRPVRA